MNNTISIKLAVENNKLRIVKNFVATTQMINALTVEFDFRTLEWESLSKTVVFKRRGIDAKLVLLPSSTNSCIVPWEILDDNNDGIFEIGVFGIGVNEERLPTNSVAINFKKGCYAQGESPSTPTPDIYEQLTRLLQEKISVSDLHSLIRSYCDTMDYATKVEVETKYDQFVTDLIEKLPKQEDGYLIFDGEII